MPASLSTSHSPSASAFSTSSSSSAASIEPDSRVDLSFGNTEQEAEVDLVVLPIVYEEEGKEDMVANLRAESNKRQCKHLSESITIIPPPTKKPCPKILYLKPILAIAPAPEPLAAAVGSNPPLGRRLLLTNGAAHLELGRPFTGPEQLSDDSVECVAFVPPCPYAPCAPSREEITELMKQISYFTEREAPVTNMRVLFSATR